MTLARRNLLTSSLLALPVAIVVLLAVNWIDRRDRARLLETAAEAYVNDVMRDACVNDPRWFLAGARTGRPRPEEYLQPDADVRLPRPSADPLPFEYFAYDEQFTPTSVAGPRFTEALMRRMRASPPERVASGTYRNALGSGVEAAVLTRWTPGPCAVLLFRQLDPQDRAGTSAALFAAVYLLSALAAWLGAAPTYARMRRLSKEAKDSTKEDYAAMVGVSGSDEIGSLAAVFNDSAADIKKKATGIRDREDALRRYVEGITEDVARPLASLEGQLAGLAAGRDDAGLRHAAKEAHRLAMALKNQAAVNRLRSVTDATPRGRVDLAGLVRSLAADRGPLAAACGVAIDVAKCAETIVQADAQLMEQAIANVLDNAIVYNRPGGTVRIELTPYDHGRRYRLLVADSGPGVSDEEFEGLTANRRFRGDESRTRRPGGRGLGLALAREIADRFGMQLDLRQPAGGGFEAEFSTRT